MEKDPNPYADALDADEAETEALFTRYETAEVDMTEIVGGRVSNSAEHVS